jgi:hypothetical protein
MNAAALFDRLALRFADALPALMIFGPVGGLACLAAGTLSERR